MAESVGFEPTGLWHPLVFKTSALGRSATTPNVKVGRVYRVVWVGVVLGKQEMGYGGWGHLRIAQRVLL